MKTTDSEIIRASCIVRNKNEAETSVYYSAPLTNVKMVVNGEGITKMLDNKVFKGHRKKKDVF